MIPASLRRSVSSGGGAFGDLVDGQGQEEGHNSEPSVDA